MYSLQQGTRLHEFELTDPIGEGGFSIVYRAWDHSLERVVALKEYMPGSLATRDQDTRVHVRSSALQSTFDAGLRSFVNESKLLASFEHPSLVKVYRFWEANGTAYMVMPFYEGLTLRDTVQAMSAPPSQEWILEVLAPLVEALGYIHARHCYHRDIAPDNILMLADSGRPLLLDFGAARRVITDMSQALTVIVKAGYAPIEQYAEVAEMTQGSWTDVHALAAVIYWLVTGKKPPAAIARMLKDNFVPLAELRPAGYSIEFLSAVDRGLALLPQNRTRTIEAFAEDIGLRRASPALATANRPRGTATDPTPRPSERDTGVHPPPDRPVENPRAVTMAPAAEPSLDVAAIPDEDDDLTVAHPAGATSIPPPSPAASQAQPAPPSSSFAPVAASALQVDDEVDERDEAPVIVSLLRGGAPAGLASAPAPTMASRPQARTVGSIDSAPARPALPLILGGGIAVAAVAAIVAWLMWRTPAQTQTPTSTAVPTASAVNPARGSSLPAEPVPLPRDETSAASAAAHGSTEVVTSPVPAPVDATSSPAPTPRLAAPPAGKPTRPAPSAHPTATANPNASECARIMQRLSLGENAPDLLERAGKLHCK